MTNHFTWANEKVRDLLERCVSALAQQLADVAKLQ